MKWHSAPGQNRISSNATKKLNDQNKHILYKIIFGEGLDFNNWLKSKLILVPKIGNESILNNWRGINLLDVTSKIVCIILNKQLQQILDKEGVPILFGTTKKTGCQDSFSH